MNKDIIEILLKIKLENLSESSQFEFIECLKFYNEHMKKMEIPLELKNKLFKKMIDICKGFKTHNSLKDIYAILDVIYDNNKELSMFLYKKGAFSQLEIKEEYIENEYIYIRPANINCSNSYKNFLSSHSITYFFYLNREKYKEFLEIDKGLAFRVNLNLLENWGK